MNTNLEFRIWDKQRNKFRKSISSERGLDTMFVVDCDGKVLQLLSNDRYPNETKWVEQNYEEGRFEASQYTGFKDKEGVKAFTGDKVEYQTGEKGEVIFSEFHCGYMIMVNDSGVRRMSTGSWKIVGNKWEEEVLKLNPLTLDEQMDILADIDKMQLEQIKYWREHIRQSALDACADKPPLGLRPRHIAETQRMEEINTAISRYLEKGEVIPKEWIEELQELNDKRGM